MSDIYATKKKGESFESLFRRFTKRVQRSGKILTLRGRRFHEKKPGKNKVHESALRRLAKKDEFEYLIRSGKAKEEDLRGRRRRR